MKPYYEHAGITIYHGDAREVLPSLPVAFCRACNCELTDESILAIHLAAKHDVGPFVGLLLTDPPYGIGYSPGGGGRGRYPNGKQFSGEDSITGDDAPFDPSHLLRHERVVLWGANHYADKLPPSPTWYVWDKRVSNSLSNDFADCEMAWTNVGGPARVFRHLWNGLLKDSERGDKRWHPSQKPLALMDWVVKKAARVGDMIVDPYMGSATTLLAAKKSSHPAIGIEIEEKYCEIAAKRLEQEVFQFGEGQLEKL